MAPAPGRARISINTQPGAGTHHDVLQEVDSEGNQIRFAFEVHGERFVPPRIYETKLLEPREFVRPSWGWRRVDWRDVFNGHLHSGCWGIEEPSRRP